MCEGGKSCKTLVAFMCKGSTTVCTRKTSWIDVINCAERSKNVSFHGCTVWCLFKCLIPLIIRVFGKSGNDSKWMVGNAKSHKFPRNINCLENRDQLHTRKLEHILTLKCNSSTITLVINMINLPMFILNTIKPFTDE